MKGGVYSLLWLAACFFGSWPVTATGVRYTLLEGSYFTDECLICDRATILQPLQGSFDLLLVQDTAPYTRYSLSNLDFIAGSGTSLERHLSGEGTYVRFEDFAVVQNMTLNLQVKDAYTTQAAFFTNGTGIVERPFPLLQLSLTQTNGTLLQTFTLRLVAAPVREIWFSTATTFTAAKWSAPTNQVSDGALISNLGRIVKRNEDLAGRLGVMPVVQDLGLDAADVGGNGEILFSIPVNVFSESLGQIQHGDLLSNRGAIVKRNQVLLTAFNPKTTFDAGLDAVQVMPDGEVLFSIRSNVVINSGLRLSHGDILSDRGMIYLNHERLLVNFQPAVTNYDYGLDALYIFPSGEIWFSVEEGFDDQVLGRIQSGDLLSSLGYRVFSNQELLTAFAPTNSALDYGLDALYVVTDTQPSNRTPQFPPPQVTGGVLHFQWSGPGSVFQIETAPVASGSWVPCTPLLPDTSFDVQLDQAQRARFYRLRQW